MPYFSHLERASLTVITGMSGFSLSMSIINSCCWCQLLLLLAIFPVVPLLNIAGTTVRAFTICSVIKSSNVM